MKHKPLLLAKNKGLTKTTISSSKVKAQIITKKIMSFYTPNDNNLKDFVVSNVGVLLAEKSEVNRNILIIDFNGPNPSLDHYLGVTKEVFVKDIYNTTTQLTGVTACYSAIEKGVFNATLLKNEFVKKVKNYKNLSLLTGVYDRNMFEKIGKIHYEKIIKAAAEVFDTVLISTNPYLEDTATFTSLQNCDEIIVVSDATYTSLRAAGYNVIKEELIKYQNFPNEKFKFIVGNMSSRSLDKQEIKEILKEFEILGFVNENKYSITALNNKTPLVLTAYGKNDVINFLDIIANIGYIPKISFMDKLLKKTR